MNNKLDLLALGYAGAAVSAFGMLLLGISGNLGIYEGAVEMMRQWHMFFSLDLLGIISGMVEAAIISFILVCLFGFIYNKFSK